MNIEKRFIEIGLLIKQYQNLINTEALDFYPFVNNSLEIVKEELNFLQTLTEPEIMELELSQKTKDFFPIKYQSLLDQIHTLTKFDKVSSTNKLYPPEIKRRLTPKKLHEINKICHLMSNDLAKNFVDIGSGAGHLSSFLLQENNKRSLCIDSEKEYQNIGLKKLKRSSPETLERLSFKTALVDENNLSLILEDRSFLLGLHSCGNLSVDIIKSAKNPLVNGLLSIGCCYHKLTSPNLNLSSVSRELGVNLNKFSLTMAAKTAYRFDKKLYDQKLKVKNYRYSAHFLMKKKLNLPFKSFGNASKSDYQLPFHEYIYKFIPEAKALTSKEINDFYQENLNDVKRVLNIGILRSHFAKLIEAYIILDRALLLKESGHDPQVLEIFDSSLSPRNLAIYVPTKA